MSVTDPVADALTVIRNASRANKETAEIKASKLLGEILKLLKREGFIKDFRSVEYKKQGLYKVYLKLRKGKVSAITGIRKVSMPGYRRYVPCDEVPKVYSGLGIAILSTSKGILTDDEARKMNVGGELLCKVW